MGKMNWHDRQERNDVIVEKLASSIIEKLEKLKETDGLERVDQNPILDAIAIVAKLRLKYSKERFK